MYTDGMGSTEKMDRKAALLADLVATCTAFHAPLDSMFDADLRRRSKNPGWTNGEVLFHMTLEEVVRDPTVHFGFHLDQVSR